MGVGYGAAVTQEGDGGSGGDGGFDRLVTVEGKGDPAM